MTKLYGKFRCSCSRSYEVEVKEVTEGLPPQVEPVQSVVGAAGCGVKQGESGVGASRQTLSELKTLVGIEFARADSQMSNVNDWQLMQDCYEAIMQHLKSIEAAAQEQDVL